MYIFLIFWALVNIFPIYFMFTFSLKSNEEIFGKNIVGLPEKWLWSNYTTALNTGNMGLYFVNSLLITISAIAISLFAAMMATYAITRIRWRMSRLTNAFFMLGLTIPIQASIVPVPPESSDSSCSFLPGGWAFTSMPQFSGSLGSIRISSAWPPPKRRTKVSEK